VEAWDWDRHDDDDRLGRSVFTLADVDGGKNSFSRWFEMSRFGLGKHPCGRVHLHMDYMKMEDVDVDEVPSDSSDWERLRQVSPQAIRRCLWF